MHKTQRIISFQIEYLNSLVADETSSVIVQEQQYHLALHPYHLNNIKQSIKDLLSQKIARYDQKLGGILLGFENTKLLTEGVIMNDSCFIHIDVSANFFIFKPEVGQILVGVVNKKSKDHVGCLLYNTFNVSLPKPEDQDVESWSGTYSEIGNEIKFRITFMKLQARLPYIRGQLIDEDSPKRKKNKILTVVAEETPTTSKKKKKKKDVDLDEEYLPNGFGSSESSIKTEINDTSVKESKKRKRESMEESPKKKKKLEQMEDGHKKSKRKKSINENEFNINEKLKQENDSELSDTPNLDIDISIDNLISNELSNRSHKKKKRNKGDTLEVVGDADSLGQNTVISKKKRKRAD
ncbi:hypothetical protein PPYR_09758 [Photinus pyralis]|uniref:DNA-directed RNA polymerase I subunit RPA43 n=1 Tax=Photinus pyralis TaxID=7054 RepID=A0A1Y1MRS7_PHOPY|nr:DNA-directed RNA polymerase I subunit RPA43-like [Photinus pyralis]KAB0795697.1 hypothetical protein PPYR_09758 [Photinus pyralis]